MTRKEESCSNKNDFATKQFGLILHQTSLKKVTFLGSNHIGAYDVWQLCGTWTWFRDYNLFLELNKCYKYINLLWADLLISYRYLPRPGTSPVRCSSRGRWRRSRSCSRSSRRSCGWCRRSSCWRRQSRSPDILVWALYCGHEREDTENLSMF